MSKKIFSLFLMILIIFITTGCNNEEKQEVKNKTQLVFASTKDIRDVNPHIYRGEMAAQNMLFESLIINTKDGIKPWLAKSWDITNEARTYTFSLRDDVKFSDGTVFDANVVKQNFDAILRNKVRHGWLELINEIKSTKVIDKYTFQLNLHNAYYPTLTELAMTRPLRFVSPKCFVNNETNDKLACYSGTGPWVLDEHKKNDYALFNRNENYWNEKPKIKSVKWRVIPSHQSILLSLQKGEVDLIFGADGDMINLNAFEAIKKDANLQTLVSEPISSRAILLNSKTEFTKDIQVRKALELAVNKEALIKGILNGSETIAHALFSKATPYCNIDLEVRNFDENKANELLENAGWILNEKENLRYKDGKALSLALYFNASNAQEKIIGEYLQSNFKNIGVELKIIGEESQSFYDRQKAGDFDLMYSLSWGLPYDPQSFVSSWRTPSHGDYHAQAGMPKKEWMDKTIKKILIEPDMEKRQELYTQVLTYLHEQSVYIPLSYSRTKTVYVPNLKGVNFNLSQYEIPFEKMFFEK